MIQTIDISLIPSDNKPVINVSQFDNISRVLHFNVFDDAEMETPHVFDDGDTVLLNIRKNDNNIVVITGEIITETDPETQEVTGQHLTFELTEQACACVGSNFGEVSITSGDDEVIGSCNFKLIVERSPLSGGVSSQTAIDNLTTQIEQITEEVIGENYYTKTETDNLLDDKANVTDLPDMSDYYTKTETDNLLDDKANVTDLPDMSDYYTKTETDYLLDDKANVTDLPDMSDYYTKIETDNQIAALIDDTATTSDKTWSSDKISDELYALLPVGTVTGEIAIFNTELSKPLVSLKADIDYDSNGIDNVYINYIDMNQLVNVNSLSPITLYGVTITPNEDGTITVSGTATNNIVYDLTPILSLGGDTVFYRGCPVGGSANTYGIGTFWIGSISDVGNGIIYKTPTASNSFKLQIMIKSGTAITTPITFKPQCYNLTKLFGSRVYDYLNTLPDKGFSVVDDILYKDIYPYNAGGELVSIASVNDSDYPCENIDISSYNVYGGNIYIDSTRATLTSTLNADGTEKTTPDIYELSNVENLNTLLGDNSFFTNVGDITVQYKDTIANYIDTRVNTVSNRSLSMMRTIANQVADERTIDNIVGVTRTSTELERGDNNDDNAR